MTKKVKLVAIALSLSFTGLQAQTKYFDVSPNKVVVLFAENADTKNIFPFSSSISNKNVIFATEIIKWRLT